MQIRQRMFGGQLYDIIFNTWDHGSEKGPSAYNKKLSGRSIKVDACN